MDEYAELMNNLKLPNPKMMDVAVPANMRVGLHQEEVARKGWALTAAEAIALRGRPDVAIVDLREKSEREKHGVIPGSLHAPYPSLQEEIGSGGMLHELAQRRRQAHRFPVRLRRALGDGGAGGAGRRAEDLLSHLRRHRRLEEGERTAGAAIDAAQCDYAARSTRLSISLRSVPKSIGLVSSASAPFSSALRLVSASP